MVLDYRDYPSQTQIDIVGVLQFNGLLKLHNFLNFIIRLKKNIRNITKCNKIEKKN